MGSERGEERRQRAARGGQSWERNRTKRDKRDCERQVQRAPEALDRGCDDSSGPTAAWIRKNVRGEDDGMGKLERQGRDTRPGVLPVVFFVFFVCNSGLYSGQPEMFLFLGCCSDRLCECLFCLAVFFSRLHGTRWQFKAYERPVQQQDSGQCATQAKSPKRVINDRGCTGCTAGPFSWLANEGGCTRGKRNGKHKKS